MAVALDDEDLAGLRIRLKSGEYDGVDVMQAWLAVDELRELRAELQAAWQAGLDAGREQGRGKDHAHPSPSVPVGVEWPLSLLRAGHWREVHVGRRYMRLEVTYDYAAWERLMAEVESALSQQPAAVDEECAHCVGGIVPMTFDRLCTHCRGTGIAAQPGGSDNDR